MEQKKTKSWKTIVKRLLVVALVLSSGAPDYGSSRFGCDSGRN